MKNAVFIDSDIILDVLLEREPHFKDSQTILGLAESNDVRGFTSSLIIANCFYIIENQKNQAAARNSIAKLRSILHVLPFSDKEIGESLNSNFKDFEDGIQHYIALNNNIDAIITRNTRDFKNAGLPVMTPAELLSSAGISS